MFSWASMNLGTNMLVNGCLSFVKKRKKVEEKEETEGLSTGVFASTHSRHVLLLSCDVVFIDCEYPWGAENFASRLKFFFFTV